MVKYLKMEDCKPGDKLRDKDGYYYQLSTDLDDFKRFRVNHGLYFIASNNPYWNAFIPKGRVDELNLMLDHEYLNKRKLDYQVKELLDD